MAKLETQTMISGDLVYVKKEGLQELREERGNVERMLKAMIKSPEDRQNESWTPWTLSPS